MRLSLNRTVPMSSRQKLAEAAPEVVEYRRPEPPLAASSTPATSSTHDVESLSNKVAALERALNQTLALLQQQNGISGRHDASPSSASVRIERQAPRPSSASVEHEDELEDAATVLEFLAWGRRKDTDGNDRNAASMSAGIGDRPQAGHKWSRYKAMELQSLDEMLPDARQVRAIVDSHISNVLWYDCSYHAATFRSELETFYSLGGSVHGNSTNGQWVALLFAVLASGLACASSRTLSTLGYSPAEGADQAAEYYDASVTCLEMDDYMSNPSLHAIQAIATLTLPAHLLGRSTKQSILIATGIRLAQTLNMHRIKPETSTSHVVHIDREVRRRVWCQLATQDFFSTPFSESHTINLLLTTTDPPSNCIDGIMRPLPDSEPTITSFVRFKYRIAVLLPQLQDAMARAGTLHGRYEKVLEYDSKMRDLATKGRPEFLGPGPLRPEWPHWIPWARRALRISSAHKIIMLHRKYLGLSFTNQAFAFTRRTCIAASTTILKCQKDDIDESSPVLWIEHAFVVTACRDPEWEMHGRSVDDAVRILEQSPYSSIAVRGVDLLRALRKKTTQTNHDIGRKRPYSDDIGSTSKKARQFDTNEFVNDFMTTSRGRTESITYTDAALDVDAFRLFAMQDDGLVFGQPLDFNDQVLGGDIDWMQAAFNSPVATGSAHLS
ncbi:hypothetical protein MRB53_037081 [Persea americana]|nr:hypothetical protein MRB53_037081 [Persea americana]